MGVTIPPGPTEIHVRGANPPVRLDDAILRMAATGKMVAEMEMVTDHDGNWTPSKKEKKRMMRMMIKKVIKMMKSRTELKIVPHMTMMVIGQKMGTRKMMMTKKTRGAKVGR